MNSIFGGWELVAVNLPDLSTPLITLTIQFTKSFVIQIFKGEVIYNL